MLLGWNVQAPEDWDQQSQFSLPVDEVREVEGDERLIVVCGGAWFGVLPDEIEHVERDELELYFVPTEEDRGYSAMGVPVLPGVVHP